MAEQPEYDLEAFVYQAQCFIHEGSKSFLSLKGTLGTAFMNLGQRVVQRESCWSWPFTFTVTSLCHATNALPEYRCAVAIQKAFILHTRWRKDWEYLNEHS